MKKRKYIADINVTPFVDVLLVLLVIFLVAVPAVVSQIPVVLPKSSNAPSVSHSKPVFVTLTATGRIFVQDKPLADVSGMKDAIAAEGEDVAVYIRGDENVKYGEMINIMNVLRDLKYPVSLVTEDVSDGIDLAKK